MKSMNTSMKVGVVSLLVTDPRRVQLLGVEILTGKMEMSVKRTGVQSSFSNTNIWTQSYRASFSKTTSKLSLSPYLNANRMYRAVLEKYYAEYSPPNKALVTRQWYN